MLYPGNSETHPELPKTSRVKEYTVVMRQQARNCKISVYDSKFNKISNENVLKHRFYVKDVFKKMYELKTKSNGLKEGDKIQVYFENGDYKIKKVDNNV
jgi:exonuclease VII large subunit